MTPVQAGLSTDHDLLESDFVAMPRRVRIQSNQLTLKSSNCRLCRVQLSLIACHVIEILTPAGLIGNPPFGILLMLIFPRIELGIQTHNRGLIRKLDIC